MKQHSPLITATVLLIFEQWLDGANIATLAEDWGSTPLRIEDIIRSHTHSLLNNEQ